MSPTNRATGNGLTRVSKNMIENLLRLARGRIGIVIVLVEPIDANETIDKLLHRRITLLTVVLLISTASIKRLLLKHVTIIVVRAFLVKKKESVVPWEMTFGMEDVISFKSSWS